MLTFGLVSSVQKCALHTIGVPVVNYGDVQNVCIMNRMGTLGISGLGNLEFANYFSQTCKQ